MIAGHRWEYQPDYRGYKCVGLPLGGVESYQWCVGCGCLIGDIEIREAGFKDFREFHLDILANGKGYEPIEAGTLAESRLRHKIK